jgi:hypothetical protein
MDSWHYMVRPIGLIGIGTMIYMGNLPMPTRKTYTVGGSLVVSIPADLQDRCGIDEGMTVLVSESDGGIRIAEAEVSEAHRPDGGQS